MGRTSLRIGPGWVNDRRYSKCAGCGARAPKNYPICNKCKSDPRVVARIFPEKRQRCYNNDARLAGNLTPTEVKTQTGKSVESQIPTGEELPPAP